MEQEEKAKRSIITVRSQDVEHYDAELSLSHSGRAELVFAVNGETYLRLLTLRDMKHPVNVMFQSKNMQGGIEGLTSFQSLPIPLKDIHPQVAVNVRLLLQKVRFRAFV